jgi:hypothetical protein
VLSRVARWTKAMPQYHVGHPGRVETIERCAAAQDFIWPAGRIAASASPTASDRRSAAAQVFGAV